MGTPAWPWDPPTDAGLKVRITYSGPMSLGITPTVTFAPAVASTLTFDAAHSWWVSDTTYKAAFDVADANVYVPHVGIVVTGAKDAAGNLQTPYSGTDDFSIDTLTTPVTVLSVTPSVTTVTDTNVGTAGDPGNPNAGFAVRIAYSAAMNTSSALADLHAGRSQHADLQRRSELVDQRLRLQGRLQRGGCERERCGH